MKIIRHTIYRGDEMCGITGIVQFNEGVSSQRIEKMTSTLEHRGPDQEGYYKEKYVHFGHRRLSIIDLQFGVQPMKRTIDGTTYIIIYNGELYNTQQVKDELVLAGYHFETNSDTEVLLMSFIHWKERCTEKINGIFAFAVYAKEQETIHLFRDRVGVKPLFYSFQEGNFVFASEIKAILAFTDNAPVVNVEGLSMLLSIGPSRVPGKTVYENIYEVLPAHYIKITEDEFYMAPYYTKASKTHEEDFSQTVNNVRELVTDAVERQLVSDVPVCTFLSGGIDSSIISMISAKKQPTNTFSLQFKQNNVHFKPSSYQHSEDGPFIEQVSSYIGSTHHIIEINEQELFNTLLDALKAKDYPSMADIDSSLLLLCQRVQTSYKVGLSGECADELFGGYPWFQKGHEAQQHTLFPWITSIVEREHLLKKKWRDKLKLKTTMTSMYEEAIAKVKGFTDIEKLFYLNEQFFMQTLLERKDRMSMATSLEVRVPFADDNLVNYVWNIPWDMKQYGGLEKGILRQAFKGQLPDEVLFRKKNPFPKTHHPNFTKLVQQELFKRWQNEKSILRELFEAEPFEQLIASGGSSFKKPWFGQLMTGPQLLAYFIQLDEWYTSYNVQLIE
jgi:asparagine synthase (glutamine-hydrolysing)